MKRNIFVSLVFELQFFFFFFCDVPVENEIEYTNKHPDTRTHRHTLTHKHTPTADRADLGSAAVPSTANGISICSPVSSRQTRGVMHQRGGDRSSPVTPRFCRQASLFVQCRNALSNSSAKRLDIYFISWLFQAQCIHEYITYKRHESPYLKKA